MTDERPETASAAERKPRTTISVYTADRDWLQQRQREISAARKQWVDMPQLISEFVSAIRKAEESA